MRRAESSNQFAMFAVLAPPRPVRPAPLAEPVDLLADAALTVALTVTTQMQANSYGHAFPVDVLDLATPAGATARIDRGALKFILGITEADGHRPVGAPALPPAKHLPLLFISALWSLVGARVALNRPGIADRFGFDRTGGLIPSAATAAGDAQWRAIASHWAEPPCAIARRRLLAAFTACLTPQEVPPWAA